MKRAEKVLIPLGAAGLLILLWRLDVRAVQTALLQVGWGMVLILGQETVAHVLNALGWRFAFSRDHAASASLGELLRLRVAGDAINYLTPTATLGGEVARTAMLSATHGPDVRAVSVIIAKSTQTLAQVIFIVVGLIFVTSAWIVPRDIQAFLPWGLSVGMVIAALLFYRVKARSHVPVRGLAWVRRWAIGARLIEFLRQHPGRVALSTLMFALGYTWGAIEAYWICRFLLIPVSLFTALAIEVLSVAIDGVLFMVPAKIGTQEGGKVAVFAALGLPLSLGLAFGIIRHMRELAWAALGMWICWIVRRPRPVVPA